MAIDVALTSESSPDAREALLEMLRGLGYVTFDASRPSELEDELVSSLVINATSLFVVADVLVAKACNASLERCARQRKLRRASLPAIALTFEPGGLTTIARPALLGCDTLVIAERPVALAELRSAALECKVAARCFDADMAR